MLKKIFVVVIVLFLLAVSTAYAEKATVWDGYIPIHSGRREITIPMEMGMTVYDKVQNDLVIKIDDPDYFANVEKNLGDGLNNWSSKRGTIPTIIVGENSSDITEVSLQFGGVKNVEEVKAMFGGVTELPMTERPYRGRVVYIDNSKIPAGTRFLWFDLGHKDNLSITYLAFLKFTTLSNGHVAVGIEINCIEAPPFYKDLTPRAKRTFLHGLYKNVAMSDNPQIVEEDLKKIAIDKANAEKAIVTVSGVPNSQVEYGYVGLDKPLFINLDEKGILVMSGLEPGKILKVRYPGGPWLQQGLEKNGEYKLDLGQVPVVAKTYRLVVANRTNKKHTLRLEFYDQTGELNTTLDREALPMSWKGYRVPEGWKVVLKGQGFYKKTVTMTTDKKVNL